MRLTVSTPLTRIVEADDVIHVRAEDDTGAFGLLQGHADFITVLAVSLLSWRDSRGAEHHVAVRGGLLEIRGGARIEVATPEAVAGDDLTELESTTLEKFRRELEEERAAHADAQRLYLAAIHQIVRLLRPQRSSSAAAGEPPPLAGDGTTP
ncbi:MAG TPA: F0F1 ATP synthase subunit epsilon [Steroidobacteraceae bacterium]|nr:F0F1 ATP synthase subunit epsilon [Steroidobacteraceae bacterium]